MSTNEPTRTIDVDFTNGGKVRTAILAIHVEAQPDGTVNLGVDVLVPLAVPGAQSTVYRPQGVAINITPAKRDEIVTALLAGKQSKGPNDEGTKSASPEGEGASSVAPNQQHPRGR